MSGTLETSFLDKNKLHEEYLKYKPHFDILLSRLVEHIQSIFQGKNYSFSLKNRVKSFESYYRKVQKYNVKSVEGEIPVLTDILAIRVMCSFMSDLKPVKSIILENFECCDIEDKGINLNYREFGYNSIHLLLHIPEEFKVGLILPKGLVLEIQVRTILQDAWAEIEHDLVYKAELTSFDDPMRRKLAAINASLTLADIVFQEISDYQKKLNSELDIRRFDFYAKADKFTEEFLNKEVPDLAEKETKKDELLAHPIESIDDMLIAALEAHNNSNFSLAIEIYTVVVKKIIEKNEKNKDNALSIIYKHRGMAYFSKGDYEIATKDFELSAKSDPRNFRAYYYKGIALVLLGKNNEAIEEFTASLKIKNNQAHVYFRRALSYYNVASYVEALADLDVANSLGLDSIDAKKLRIAIAKKIDII